MISCDPHRAGLILSKKGKRKKRKEKKKKKEKKEKRRRKRKLSIWFIIFLEIRFELSNIILAH